MSAKFSVRDFFKAYPDDAACLRHIMTVRYGLTHECKACGKEATFHPLSKRRAYACAQCGHHVYPCAGTIFQDSRTPLTLWFYAIYLFVTTRHGVSGKELERQLGVTYKCAYRMGNQIRHLMAKADSFQMLQGHVEIDESYIGGKVRGRVGTAGKTIVVALKERGGDIRAEVIPNVKKETLRAVTRKHVETGSVVSTDELASYSLLTEEGYQRGTVKHHAKEWAASYGDARHHVNHVESFWTLFKRSIRSTHIHISPAYMNRYLGEFTFRSNHRQMQNAMFDLLIGAL